jgi:prolyl-tRNA synthetase
MRVSRFFMPLLRETPADAQIVSHRYMLRAGIIKQAGGRDLLLAAARPSRAPQRIEQIVRGAERAGAVELLMPTLQSADLWRESGRYDAYGKEMLRIKDRQDREMLYGPTNEEMITDIFRASRVAPTRTCRCNLYHIQWKFRDEMRPRFGVMRGREFLMKDAYSFDIDARAPAGPTAACCGLSAHLRRLGLKRSRCGRHRPDRRRPEPRIHRPGRDRRKSGLLPQGPGRHAGPRHVDFDGDLRPYIEQFTSLYAAPRKSTTPKPSPPFLPTSSLRRAASRSATSSISARSTPSR